MKNYFLIILFTAFSSYSIASDECEDIYVIADNVMKLRQNNVPMKDVLTIQPDSVFLQTVVVDAWKHKVYLLDNTKYAVQKEFASTWMDYCKTVKSSS